MACLYGRIINIIDGGFLYSWIILPFVIEPKCWQYRNGCSFCTSIRYLNFYKNIFAVILRVFYKNIKIIIGVENAGVQYFIFCFLPCTLFIFFKKIEIWVFILRILIQVLHVIMRRKIV